MSESDYTEGAQLVAAGATMVKITQESMQAISVQRPRELEKVLLAIIEELDRVPDWAARGFYRRKISATEYATGPSVYLTRLVSRQFGNCSVRSYLSTQTPEVIQIAGVFIDLERNFLAERMQAVSPMAWRKGRGNAKGYYETLAGEKLMNAILIGASKAERNAVAVGVPDWIMQAAFSRCRSLAADDTKKRLSAMVQQFAALGVSREQLDRHFEGKPLEKLTDDEYADLRGIYTAVSDRETMPAEIGALPEDEEPAEVKEASATLDTVLGSDALTTGGTSAETPGGPPNEQVSKGGATRDKASPADTEAAPTEGAVGATVTPIKPAAAPPIEDDYDPGF